MASREDVYREYGRAAEQAQLLETELGTYLFAYEGLKARAFLLERWDEGHAILETINKKTLGQALCEAKRRLNLTPDIESVFEDALDARNKLVHGFFLRHGFAITTESGRDEMVAELVQLRERIQPAYELAGLIASHVSVDEWTLESTVHHESPESGCA